MGKLRLSGKERRRLEVLAKVKRGDIRLTKAADLLGVGYRQVLRIWKRFEREGSAGLKHGLRDRPSNRRMEAGRRERVLELYQGKYGDFGPTLAVEYLRKDDGEELSEETLRRWLMAAGLWQARRQGARHRKWRERRAHWGEMVQMDGSEHDWFEGRRERAALMVLIDDATNWTYAKFFESETTAAAMSVFGEYVGLYGLPRSLYVDRASIYETTRDSTVAEALQAVGPLTQFGRAMQELEVALILARSPQAKGRVERRHGVFQDRFVKALRLKKIDSLEGANEYLAREFLQELNERFSVAARSEADLHRPLGRGVRLEHVLSYQEERVVQNDGTVSWRNRNFQLDERHRKLSLARKKILVSELLDGTIRLTSRGENLRWIELPERPVPVKREANRPRQKKAPYKPAASHPWRGRKG
jgi:transposase